MNLLKNMNAERASMIKAYAAENGWAPGMITMYALCMGIKGNLVKSFKDGQELREYTIDGQLFKVRAFPVQHNS